MFGIASTVIYNVLYREYTDSQWKNLKFLTGKVKCVLDVFYFYVLYDVLLIFIKYKLDFVTVISGH